MSSDSENARLSPGNGAPHRLGRFGSPLRPLKQPIVAFGLALAGLIWLGAISMIDQERAVLRAETTKDANNLSAVLEQTVLETVRSLDNTLKFLRGVEKHDNYNTNWPLVLAEERSVDNEAIQLSVTDDKGTMIASSVDRFAHRPIDLSDRAHFKAQLQSASDDLFIGGVVIGRTTGLRSVQFSRKRVDENGRFLGVVVASLPADQFDRHFATLDLATNSGLALVGDDGEVRAGMGAYGGLVGKKLDDIDVIAGQGFTSVRRVAGYPLTVIASLPDLEASPSWKWRKTFYLAGAAVGSGLALLLSLGVAFRRDRYETHIVNLSRHDGLTGLANRAFLLRELERACATSERLDRWALHLIDLDNFKTVNDTHGHGIGDELLSQVAERLAALIGPRDLAARLGGDEFAVLQYVENFDVDAPALARGVGEEMSRAFSTTRAQVCVGASIGLARAGRDGSQAAEIMKSADLALYAAKNGGRGRYRIFDPSLAEAARKRQQIENGLRAALSRNELHIAYQPICSIQDGRTIGYEALLRWRPSDGVQISPAEFIPIAEEIGAIVDIGAWVLRTACADIARGPSDLKISVNASPAQFEAGDFARTVIRALDHSGLSPKRLHIEITESLLMKDNAAVLAQLRDIRALGVSVSIDDFGTGYSCLSYLEIYPIDTLKIDQQFVRKIGVREDAVKTLRAIIDLAASFGMTTIAEGVETPEQLQTLRELGCQKAQGYLLGRPGPLPAPLLETEARMRGAAA